MYAKHLMERSQTRTLCFSLPLLTMLVALHANGADRFWVASGTGNWSDNANWSTTSGGGGGATVPGTADTARFDAAGAGDCTIDADIDVAGFNIDGYSGTVTQASGVRVTIGNYSQNSGAFAGGDGLLFFRGTFNLTGGTFTCPDASVTNSQPGLTGDFYDGTDFQTYVSRAIDATINLPVADPVLGPRSNGNDTYSARWTGEVLADASGTYTFTTRSDDGVRLWVNGELIIERWRPQGPTNWSGRIDLEAGNWYHIRLEMYELGGGAAIELRYDPPGAAGLQIIPSTNLRTNDDIVVFSRNVTIGAGAVLDFNGSHAIFCSPFSNNGTLRVQGDEIIDVGMDVDSGTVTYYGTGNYSRLGAGSDYYDLQFVGTGTWQHDAYLNVLGDLQIDGGTVRFAPFAPPSGLKADYFTAANITNLKNGVGLNLKGRYKDAEVDFPNADGLGISRAGQADAYRVHWTGQFRADENGTYRLATRTDDGARLFLEGTPVYTGGWNDQGATVFAGTRDLVQGQWYDIRFEYYENGGNASAELLFRPPSAGVDSIIPTSSLRKNAPLATITGNTAIAVGATLDLNGADATFTGTFSNEGTFRLLGGETVTVTMDTDSGLTEYHGTGNYTSLAAGDAYNDLSLTGSGSWQQDAALDVNGDLSIAAGTLNSDGNDIALGGDWFRVGTYQHGGNTLTLDGGDQSISNSNTFNNLVKNVTTPATLTFEADAWQTLDGRMDFQGTVGNLLSLRSSTPGTYWHILPQLGAANRVAQYVDVQDGVNRIAPKIDPTDSVDSGHNILWFLDLQPVDAAPTATPQDGAGAAWNLFANASGGMPPYTYEWRDPGGAVISTDENPVGVVPAAFGGNVYTVIVTDELGTTFTTTVTIFLANTALTAGAQATPTDLLIGGKATLSGSASGGSGTGYTFAWAGPGGFTFNGQNPGEVTPPVGVNTYTVTVTDSWGLQATAAVDVTVYDLIRPNPAANPPQTEPQGSTNLSCVPSGGTGAYVFFEWRGPDGAVFSNAQNPGSVLPPNVGINTYTVLVRDHLGFEGTATIDVVAVESALSVLANVTATFGGQVLAGHSVSVLSGDPVDLTCIPSGGTEDYSFLWTGPNGFVSTLQNTGVTVPPNRGQNTYTVVVTDNIIGVTATDSVTVSVIEPISPLSLYVKDGWMKYRRSSTSTVEDPRDWFKLKVRGIDLNPGDRVSFTINGKPIGSLDPETWLVLDGKGKAKGQLGSDLGDLFTDVRLRFNRKKRFLRVIARKGRYANGATQALVQAASGTSNLTYIMILIDREPADALIEEAAVLPMVFRVKVKANSAGAVTEVGRKVGP